MAVAIWATFEQWELEGIVADFSSDYDPNLLLAGDGDRTVTVAVLENDEDNPLETGSEGSFTFEVPEDAEIWLRAPMEPTSPISPSTMNWMRKTTLRNHYRWSSGESLRAKLLTGIVPEPLGENQLDPGVHAIPILARVCDEEVVIPVVVLGQYMVH